MKNELQHTELEEDLLYEKKKRTVKKEIEIDMNPMVDLAFLLLTFFMLTTTFRKPQVMEIFYPIDPETVQAEEQAVKESKTLSIILGEDDRIYYYQGITDAVLKESSYASEGIRNLLFTRAEEIDGLVVLVKPHPQARYQNFVDMLDELAITESKRYSIVDFDDRDKKLLEEFLANAP